MAGATALLAANGCGDLGVIDQQSILDQIFTPDHEQSDPTSPTTMAAGGSSESPEKVTGVGGRSRTRPTGAAGSCTTSATGTGGRSGTGPLGTGGRTKPLGKGGGSACTDGSGACSSGSSPTVPVENSGVHCTIPPLPDASTLTANPKLPDPFLSLDGSRVTSKDQWTCRRAEMAAQAQKYEYGFKTPMPVGTVSGSASGGILTVSVGGKSFTVSIALPDNGTAPYPAMIALEGEALPKDELKAMGVAVISFSTHAMGAHGSQADRGRGLFFEVNGSDDGAGALIAWAWGVSRLIDALEVTPSAHIDPTRIGVTGCSRYAKGALVIGALDERIALTIPQESGVGGVGAWRVAEAENSDQGTVQTLAAATQESCWYKAALASMQADTLPIDQHEVMALVAPRGLLIIENTEFSWLGVNSCATAATAAQMVYRTLNAASNIGFTNSGHNHCQFNGEELPYLRAFVRRFLLGDQSPLPNVWNMEQAVYGGEGALEMDRWIDWTARRLR